MASVIRFRRGGKQGAETEIVRPFIAARRAPGRGLCVERPTILPVTPAFTRAAASGPSSCPMCAPSARGAGHEPGVIVDDQRHAGRPAEMGRTCLRKRENVRRPARPSRGFARMSTPPAIMRRRHIGGVARCHVAQIEDAVEPGVGEWFHRRGNCARTARWFKHPSALRLSSFSFNPSYRQMPPDSPA